MGFLHKLGTRGFLTLGTAIKKVGKIGSSAVEIVGDIGNTVAGAYGTVDSITGGALGKALKSVPLVAPATAAAGTVLKFYNKQIDPRRVAIEDTIDRLGTRIQALHHVKNPG